ncbi:hypothetical protein MMPV_005685 [Pyropia vietnamensis]
MACSKYEYVKMFEQPDTLLPSTWIVVRLDGRSFHHFTATHGYTKPNDAAGLNLMNNAARAVMASFPDIVLAFGASDEYSFLLPPDSRLFRRRASKLVSVLTSAFTAAFIMGWPAAMGDGRPLRLAPVFDGRAVVYPTSRIVRDYFAWRQADVHVNNTYNSAFWALVERGGMTPAAAERALAGTDVATKNEILWSRFGLNYNEEPAMFRKGSTLLRVPVVTAAASADADVGVGMVVATTGAGGDKQPVHVRDGVGNGAAPPVAEDAPLIAVGKQQPLADESGTGEQPPAAGAATGDTRVTNDAVAGPSPASEPQASARGGPRPPPRSPPAARHRAARRARAAARRTRLTLVTSHEDLIGDEFWAAHPHLLDRGER